MFSLSNPSLNNFQRPKLFSSEDYCYRKFHTKNFSNKGFIVYISANQPLSKYSFCVSVVKNIGLFQNAQPTN